MTRGCYRLTDAGEAALGRYPQLAAYYESLLREEREQAKAFNGEK